MAFPVPALLQWFHNQQEALLQYHFSFYLLFLTLFVLIFLNRFRNPKSLNLPPSPLKLPIIGHLHHIGALPHRSFHALSKKYGPILLLNLGQIPTLVVQSAELAKEITKTNDIIFANRPSTTASKAFLYDGKDIAFGRYGEHWRQLRKLCTLDLLSAKKVEGFRFVREEEVDNMISKIKQSCSTGNAVNLSDLVVAVTKNVISRITVGMSFEGEWGKNVYADLAKEAMELFGHSTVEDMFPSLRWIDVLSGLDKRMKNTSKLMLQYYDQVIQEHLTARKGNGGQTDRRDFVDLLLDYEQDSAQAGVELTRENIKGVLVNMFLAGTDTTYSTVTWAMAELVNHPNIMKKLQEEVRRVVGTNSEVDENLVKQMDYLNCVIKETLRLHAPVPLTLPRESSESATISGYHIPAKTRVMINVWAIGRDPRVWANPEEFIPERFIDNSIDFRGRDYDFIPFGAGRRGCPGITFGVTLVELILVNLLYRFDWELPGGESKKPMDMTEVFGLSVNLKFPVLLVPTLYAW